MSLLETLFFVLALSNFFAVNGRPAGKFSYSKHVNICFYLELNSSLGYMVCFWYADKKDFLPSQPVVLWFTNSLKSEILKEAEIFKLLTLFF